MFIKNMHGVDTIFIFPEEFDDIEFLILNHLHAFNIHSPVCYDAARAVYYLDLEEADKENMKALLKTCQIVARNTPESTLYEWSSVHNRFRLMRSYKYYDANIDALITFLSKEKEKKKNG